MFSPRILLRKRGFLNTDKLRRKRCSLQFLLFLSLLLNREYITMVKRTYRTWNLLMVHVCNTRIKNLEIKIWDERGQKVLQEYYWENIILPEPISLAEEVKLSSYFWVEGQTQKNRKTVILIDQSLVRSFVCAR